MRPSTRSAAFARFGGRCSVPGCRRVARDPHHLLPRQKWPSLIDVVENIIGVCRECHAEHEHGNRRLPYAVVAPVLALDLDARQRAYLRAHYPESAPGAAIGG